ncbi:nucleotidyltransferase family protein [bacterium]|nr:nucleotidyltransferase family protein [bacterium]
MSPRISFDMVKIVAFCQKWRISEFALFGSVLRDDFGPESDVDVLVKFFPDSHTSLFDLVDMEQELAEIVGRKVDIVCREGIEKSSNPLRKRAILDSAEVMYAA